MLEPVDRSSSTHRRYSDADVRWMIFLTKLRSTGMSIAHMREYVELARRGDSTAEDRMELLLRHRITVLAQLDDIKNSLAAIDYKIALYKESAGK
jgi:DNA-binding transcriptional MerR regulator